MSTANCPSLGSNDSLRRDHSFPTSSFGGRFAIRVVIGAFAVFALAILGSLPAENQADHMQDQGIAVPGGTPAPEAVFDGRGKWSGYSR